MSVNFRDVSIDDAITNFNAYDRLLSFSCRFCGSPQGDYLVSRTSNMTDYRYSDHACYTCACNWAADLGYATLRDAIEATSPVVEQHELEGFEVA